MCLYVSSLSSHLLLSRPSTWGYLLLEVATDSNDSSRKRRRKIQLSPTSCSQIIHYIQQPAANCRFSRNQSHVSLGPGRGGRAPGPRERHGDWIAIRFQYKHGQGSSSFCNMAALQRPPKGSSSSSRGGSFQGSSSPHARRGAILCHFPT